MGKRLRKKKARLLGGPPIGIDRAVPNTKTVALRNPPPSPEKLARVRALALRGVKPYESEQ